MRFPHCPIFAPCFEREPSALAATCTDEKLRQGATTRPNVVQLAPENGLIGSRSKGAIRP